MLTMPGAEPHHHEVGVLVCHGFTGTPHSARPWARFLAAHGRIVALPLLPGRGTRWQDPRVPAWQGELLERSFHTAAPDDVADAVFSDSPAFIRRLSPSVVRASSEAGQR